MSDLRAAVADLRYQFAAHPGEGADGEGPLADLLDAVLALIPEGAVLVTEETLAAAMEGTDWWRWNETPNTDGSVDSEFDTAHAAAAILRHLREGT